MLRNFKKELKEKLMNAYITTTQNDSINILYTFKVLLILLLIFQVSSNSHFFPILSPEAIPQNSGKTTSYI